MNAQKSAQPRLADYVRPLATRWWLILVAVVVATAGVYAYYSRKPNVYNASTLVYYQDPGNVVSGVPSAPQTDRTVLDAATLLNARSTAEQVAAKIGYHGSPEDLLKQVTVGSRAGSDFITIAASAGTPQQAAAITNAFAATLVGSLGNAVRYQIESALKLSQNQLSQTAPGTAGAVQRAQLQDQVNRLQLSLRVPTLVAKQVDTALPPTSPSSPKPLRNALFALLVSLVAAIGLAYGLERFDRRLKRPDEMEDAYGRPLLAVLPHTDDPTPTHKGQPSLGTDFREPFRILRTNIELESLDTQPRTIVVSSAMPGEGKSTVVRNMALAFREAGKTVAAVDLDLRNPALPAAFGVPEGIGVTEVLRHDVSLEDASLRLGVALVSVEHLFRAKAAGLPSLNATNGSNGNGHGMEITLLRSGEPPHNAPAVLASERLVEVLDELRDSHDIVLIDSAPVLAVTDTVPLLRYADAALFVGRLDITTRDTAKRLMEHLARVPDLNLLGIVANDLSRLEASGYGYGYGYGYGPYNRAEEGPPAEDEKPKRRGRSKQPA
jgi:Mrp family chromosome partitioning ATPase/capsular polysaccharide biosynthesis protein